MRGCIGNQCYLPDDVKPITHSGQGEVLCYLFELPDRPVDAQRLAGNHGDAVTWFTELPQRGARHRAAAAMVVNVVATVATTQRQCCRLWLWTLSDDAGTRWSGQQQRGWRKYRPDALPRHGTSHRCRRLPTFARGTARQSPAHRHWLAGPSTVQLDIGHGPCRLLQQHWHSRGLVTLAHQHLRVAEVWRGGHGQCGRAILTDQHRLGRRHPRQERGCLVPRVVPGVGYHLLSWATHLEHNPISDSNDSLL